ncbi:LRR and NB-ARC domains-containing disease resistance protein, partial [Prunus dulcis]
KQPPLGLLFTAAVFGPPPPHPATTRGGTGPKEPCRLPLPIPTGLSPCTDRSSPESGENRSVFTRFSDPPFSFVSQPNRSSKDS